MSLKSVAKLWTALSICIQLISVVYHAGTAQNHRKYAAQFKKKYYIRILLNFYQNNQKSRIYYNWIFHHRSVRWDWKTECLVLCVLHVWSLTRPSYCFFQLCQLVILEQDVGSVDLSYLIYQIAIHGFIQTRWRCSIFLCVKF